MLSPGSTGPKARECQRPRPRANRVFVIGADGKPLMPCSPRRARKLINAGRVTRREYRPFTIHLRDRDRSNASVSPIQVRATPGVRRTGIAVVAILDSTERVLYQEQLEHRTNISKFMRERASHRRRRRGTKWFRPKRYDNRKRADGWMPPTIESVVSNQHHRIRRLSERAGAECAAESGDPPTAVLLHGGTILGALWGHRTSRDIDVFLPERQNLNDLARGGRWDLEKLTKGRIEYQSSTKVTIAFENGHLDLAAARPRLRGEEYQATIEGKAETVLSPAQILHGKLYRTNVPVVRDAFDFVTAAKAAPEDLARAVNALDDDEIKTIQRNLILNNDKLATQGPSKLNVPSDKHRTPWETIGRDAAWAIRDHRYDRVLVDRFSTGVEITRMLANGTTRTTTRSNVRDHERLLRQTGVAAYLDRNHAVSLPQIISTLDHAQKSGWTGRIIDTHDREPSTRTDRAGHASRQRAPQDHRPHRTTTSHDPREPVSRSATPRPPDSPE